MTTDNINDVKAYTKRKLPRNFLVRGLYSQNGPNMKEKNRKINKLVKTSVYDEMLCKNM